MNILTPYPCPECDRNLYYQDDGMGFFNCVCGYMRFNGDAE